MPQPELLKSLAMTGLQASAEEGFEVLQCFPMNNTMMTISMQLGLEQITLDSIIELTRVRSKNIKELDRESVYRMIGISNPTVNPKMVQKVTRKLRKTYHPDALLKKGLPQEMLVFGTQLSQTFNSIYDNHFKKL